MTRLRSNADAICVGIRDRAARIGARAWWVEFEQHRSFTIAHRQRVYPPRDSTSDAPTEPNLKVRR